MISQTFVLCKDCDDLETIKKTLKAAEEPGISVYWTSCSDTRCPNLEGRVALRVKVTERLEELGYDPDAVVQAAVDKLHNLRKDWNEDD